MGSNHYFIENLEERRAVKHFGGGEVDSSSLVPVVYLAVGSDAPEDGTHPRFRFPESDLVKVY